MCICRNVICFADVANTSITPNIGKSVKPSIPEVEPVAKTTSGNLLLYLLENICFFDIIIMQVMAAKVQVPVCLVRA
jgi:hypothetical protein